MGFFRISVGTQVLREGSESVITHIVSADQVIVRHCKTGTVQQVPIRDLQPAPKTGSEEQCPTDLSLISEEKWTTAQKRYETIQPLLEAPQIHAALLEKIATQTGRHPATLYRWLQRYRQEGEQTALIPAKRGSQPGQRRLLPEVEAVIQAAIQERYLQRNRIRATKLHTEIERKCRAAGLPAPHVNTVRHRLAQLAPRTVVTQRFGSRAAREQFDPIKGHFPAVANPLAMIQIDHTKLDLIVVDEAHRQPLGRPWLTVAIDVFSRMVAGFYLSLEAPGAVSVGLCVAASILPKDALLTKWGFTTPWPVWGKMRAIHCDNGKDFRGAMLRHACQQYGIEVRFRPVRQPHYGAHIERLMGTLAQEIHTLPGTTFSHPQERRGYDSEKQSALTLGELELWLARYLVEVYQQRPHAGLGGRVPMVVYEEGIAQAGLPERCINEERLRLDFLPLEERSVTADGLVLDYISYFHDVLRPWINAKDRHGRRRQFVVRRDPRDLSVVHFFDPELQQYFAIPYRDSSHPPVSVWEWREVRRRLKEQGRNSTDENVIFRAYEQMRTLEEAAVKKTKAMRRNGERRHARQARFIPSGPVVRAGDVAFWDEKIQPFREVVIPE